MHSASKPGQRSRTYVFLDSRLLRGIIGKGSDGRRPAPARQSWPRESRQRKKPHLRWEEVVQAANGQRDLIRQEEELASAREQEKKGAAELESLFGFIPQPIHNSAGNIAVTSKSSFGGKFWDDGESSDDDTLDEHRIHQATAVNRPTSTIFPASIPPCEQVKAKVRQFVVAGSSPAATRRPGRRRQLDQLVQIKPWRGPLPKVVRRVPTLGDLLPPPYRQRLQTGE